MNAVGSHAGQSEVDPARLAAAISRIEAGHAALAAHVEAERLRLYRLFLQATVAAASPLVIDLAGHAGTTLRAIASALPVPCGWRSTRVYGRLKAGGGPRPAAGSATLPNLSRSVRRLARAGKVVRGFFEEGGELGFTPDGSVLQVFARLGPCLLQTFGGTSLLLMPEPLPETMLRGLIGQPVDLLVAHPVLEGRGYPISLAFNSKADRAGVVRFRTGLLPIALPWATEFDSAMEGGHKRRRLGAPRRSAARRRPPTRRAED